MQGIIKSVIAPSLIISILITGCASMQGSQVTIDPNDSCERYRQPLRQAEEEQRNALAKVVGTGFITAIITFMACRAAGGKSDACIAPAGGVSVLSMLVGIQQVEAGKQATQADLLRGIDKSSAAFKKRLGNLGSAARSLHQCRQQQIDSIKSRYKKGKIDRQAAKIELAGIESRVSGDQQLINALLDQNHQLVNSQIDTKAAAMNLHRDQYVPKSQTKKKIAKPKDDTQKTYNSSIDLQEGVEKGQTETVDKLKEAHAAIG